MNFSNEGVEDRLQYSDRVKLEAEAKRAVHESRCDNSPRKYNTADIKDGQRVVRRWCGKRNKSSVLMQVTRVGF